LATPDELTGLRILVVDDNATSRTILTKTLLGFGCRAESSASATQALQLLRSAAREGDAFRIALLDMQMPEMDGEQLARAAREDPLTEEVILVVLTSMGKRGDATRMEAIGCAGYLLKPVKQSQLAEALKAVLGQRQGEARSLPRRLITRHVLSEQKGPRILLAEDNPINRKLAVALLGRAGYAVETAENGRQAVDALKRESYSLVLMDVQMPEMDGLEATGLIRAIGGERGRTPIIAMTAHAMKGDRERCIAAGMDDYVAKPLQSSELFEAIDRYTGLGRHAELDRAVGAAEAVERAEPVDIHRALPYFGGDERLFGRLLHEFVAGLGEQIEELKAAAESGDVPTFTRIAHSLKSLSATFGAAQLRQAAQQLEALGLDQNLAAAPRLIQQLEAEYPRLQSYVSRQPLL
jgi:two-component system sensor histidine kinase/response regulator